MLKNITYLLKSATILSFFFIHSCVLEKDNEGLAKKYATLNLEMETKAPTPAPASNNIYDIINNYDNKIATARLYVFTGSELDTMHLFTYPLSANQYISTILVEQAANKSVYAVINEPSIMKAELDKITTIAELHNIKYKMADVFTKTEASSKWTASWDAKPLPMFGQLVNLTNINNIPNKSTVSITIPIDRVVACVEIYLACKPELSDKVYVDANSSLDIINTADSGNLLPLAQLPLSALIAEKQNVVNGPTAQETLPVVNTQADWRPIKWCYRFYTPERDCSKVEDKLAFRINDILFSSGNRRSYEVVIGNDNGNKLNTLKRNTIYRIECRVVEENTTIDFTVIEQEWNEGSLQPWTDTEIDGGNYVII